MEPIHPKCPVCREDPLFIEQGVEIELKYNKRLDFWKCPICRHELHRDVYGQDIEGKCVNIKQAAVLIAMVSDMSWPPGVPMPIPPGGSKSAGRKRDKPKPKKEPLFY